MGCKPKKRGELDKKEEVKIIQRQKVKDSIDQIINNRKIEENKKRIKFSNLIEKFHYKNIKNI